jgi:hypothetical protein
MTEAEWLACTDPRPMLEFKWGKVSDRKLRLLACACQRRNLRRRDADFLHAIDAAEAYADGEITAQQLDKASYSYR